MGTVTAQAIDELMGWTEYIKVGDKGISKQQFQFLASTATEVLFGGSAGGGKSWCLLAGALQHVDTPGYSALILRKSYADLTKAGALMDRAREWLSGTDAYWEGLAHRWRFPSGASVEFGNLGDIGAEFRYQSAEYQGIFIDEATQVPENQIRYMFSRLRKRVDIDVPLRMRYATNPGGVSHGYFNSRFIDPKTRDTTAVYIPAKIRDNPYINYDEYVGSLDHLDPITRRQLLNGDWTARISGGYFRREWYEIFADAPVDLYGHVRFWDLAASKTGKRTAGVLMARRRSDGSAWILSVVKGKWTPGARDQIIRQTAEADGRAVVVAIEQEPGSGGIAQNESIQRMLAGWTVRSIPASGEKAVRSGPFSSFSERGMVRLVAGSWNSEYLDELEAFDGQHGYMDQVDATSGAFQLLTGGGPRLALGASGRGKAIDTGTKPMYESHQPRSISLRDFFPSGGGPT